MTNIFILFILFIVYSFVGWTIEVISKLYQKHHFINRGFLIGPICPIYGVGSIAMLLLLNKYQDNILLLFTMSVVICSILEYSTSYVLEKIFNTRWWDYSMDKFNINGRICLGTMIPFGLLGVALVMFVNPFVLNIVNNFEDGTIKIISIILMIIFVVDFILSFSIISKLKDTITNIEKDATEEISLKVRKVFYDKGGLYRRLIEAFPTMISQKERLLYLKDKINDELKKYNKISKYNIIKAKFKDKK